MASVIDWTLMGRTIGRTSGRDVIDTFSIVLYDFEPASEYKLPSGHVTFDFENGTATTHDDKGNVVTTVDLISVLRD